MKNRYVFAKKEQRLINVIVMHIGAVIRRNVPILHNAQVMPSPPMGKAGTASYLRLIIIKEP